MWRICEEKIILLAAGQIVAHAYFITGQNIGPGDRETDRAPASPVTVEEHAMQRRRFEQGTSEERLTQEAEHAKAAAEGLPPGFERDLLLKKARQADTAAHLREWADSPGLRPPT